MALPNARHERFAQELAKGKSQADAYQAAGYVPSEPNASRLTRNDKVLGRVRELQAPAVKETDTTVQRLLEAGWDLIDAAKLDKDFSAASATLERVAKIAGHWIDRSQSDNRVIVYGAQPITTEEWERQYKPPALQ